MRLRRIKRLEREKESGESQRDRDRERGDERLGNLGQMFRGNVRGEILVKILL